MFGRRRQPDPLTSVPDGVPVLSPGVHRNSSKGACFMEMASFLAGERWSDHPECTHPLVAHLARLVNDEVDDDHRQQLTAMIPEVVGLHPRDPRVLPIVVRAAALAALPVAAEEVQNLMALALLNAEAMLNGDPSFDPNQLSARSRRVCIDTPGAYAWARSRVSDPAAVRALDRRRAERVLELAVQGLGDACIDDADARLVALLRAVIDEVTVLTPQRASDLARAHTTAVSALGTTTVPQRTSSTNNNPAAAVSQHR